MAEPLSRRPTARGRAGDPGTSPLDATLSARHETFIAERPPGADEDVHMTAAVVDHVIERCTAPGDLVLDPFAGFGTTLERAVRLGRRAAGVELLPERVDHVRRRVPGALVVEGDARELSALLGGVVPEAGVHLVLGSPPYMTARDHEADPLTGYERGGGDYARYLVELGEVAEHCARMLVPGGFLVWNVADIRYRGHTTRLIDDCARALERHLKLVGVTVIEWDRHPHDLVADALVVCRRVA